MAKPPHKPTGIPEEIREAQIAKLSKVGYAETPRLLINAWNKAHEHGGAESVGHVTDTVATMHGQESRLTLETIRKMHEITKDRPGDLAEAASAIQHGANVPYSQRMLKRIIRGV